MNTKSIQKFGRTLSAMVMPNIGAFIAWGLITAMFIDSGWCPNKHLSQLVGPMLTYLLPLLIAYTAGKNVWGVRGGVAGAIAAMGVVIGSDVPMFIGAMLMGPLGGYCIKKFDALVQGKIKPGFEMLVDNFSLGIIAMILAIIGYLVIGNAVTWMVNILSEGVNFMLVHKLNPLLALIVDPAKVLFLNNAVNHGIMTPLGIEQASQIGQSMLFLVDPNPGPGLGILLACWVFGKGNTKQSAPGAAIIQLFGGIHEIYFPYVLAKPALLLAVILGNVCALTFFTIANVGLVAPASPGSLISIILMAPKRKTLLAIAGVVIGTLVSFLAASPMIKKTPDFQNAEEDGESDDNNVQPVSRKKERVSKIVFSCDAGMGSSALGASKFRKRLKDAGLDGIDVTNCAIDAIPADADIVVCQKALSERAANVIKSKNCDADIYVLTNFLEDPALEALFASLTNILQKCNIITGLAPESKEDAIRRAGKLLVSNGYVMQSYVNAMLEREELTTTYMGMGLAIPHGTSEAKSKVLKSGIVVLQYPEGVDFGEEKAQLVVGIAGVGDSHVEILSKIALALEAEEVLERLKRCSDPQEIYDVLK